MGEDGTSIFFMCSALLWPHWAGGAAGGAGGGVLTVEPSNCFLVRVAGFSSKSCATGGRCCPAATRRRGARGAGAPSSAPRTRCVFAPRGPAATRASGRLHSQQSVSQSSN